MLLCAEGSLLAVAALCTGPAWLTRIGSRLTVSASAAVAVAASSLEPSSAAVQLRAVNSRSLANVKRFEGEYSDRLHPQCLRRITIEPEIKVSSLDSRRKYWVAHFVGNDVGPPGIGPLVQISCSDENIEKYGPLRDWAFDAQISADGERVDARDDAHEGRFHKANPDEGGEDWEGIRWKDGNRWFKRAS